MALPLRAIKYENIIARYKMNVSETNPIPDTVSGA